MKAGTARAVAMLGLGCGSAAWLLGLVLGLASGPEAGGPAPVQAQGRADLEPGLWRAELGDFNLLLNAVAFGPDDIWAVGDGIVHFDGQSWRQTLSGDRPRFRAIDGVARDQLWAAGEQSARWCDGYGLLYRFDGQRWLPEPSGTHQAIYGLDMLRADLGWAVGGLSQAVILRYDGRSWRPESAPEVGGLRSVQALAPDNVWAVGDRGAVVHYDGLGWEAIQGPAFADLMDVYLVQPDFGWAVGIDRSNSESAVVLAFRAGTWTLDSFGEMPPLYAVRSLDTDWTLAVGSEGVLMHHDGQAWRDVGRTHPGGYNPWGFAPHPAGSPGGPEAQADAAAEASAARASSDALAPSVLPLLSASPDPKAWAAASPSGDAPPDRYWGDGLRGLTLMPDHETLLAVGSSAQIIRIRDNLSWREEHSARRLYAIDMLDAANGWAIGPGGRPLRWDGQTWSAPPAPNAARWLTDVAVVSRDDVWVVGQKGTLLRWDGKVWTQQPRFTWLDLHSVAFSGPDNGWAVAVYEGEDEDGGPWGWIEQSFIFRWDGRSWRQVLRLCHGNLSDIAALAPDQVWFSQDYPDQRVLKWDGSGFAWHPIRGFDKPTDVGTRVNTFSVGADGSVWGAGGWTGGVAHLDRGLWRSLRLRDASGEEAYLGRIAGASRDAVWAWAGGRVLRATIDGLVEAVVDIPHRVTAGDVVTGPGGAPEVYLIGEGTTVLRYRAPSAGRLAPLATVTPALAPPLLHPTPTPFSAYDREELEQRMAALVDPEDEGPLRLDSLALMTLASWHASEDYDFLNLPDDDDSPWFWDEHGNLDPCDRGAGLPVWVATFSASPRCPSHLHLVMDGSGQNAWQMVCYPRRLSSIYLPLIVRPRSPDDPLRTPTPEPTLRSLTPEAVQDTPGSCPTATPYSAYPDFPGGA